MWTNLCASQLTTATTTNAAAVAATFYVVFSWPLNFLLVPVISQNMNTKAAATQAQYSLVWSKNSFCIFVSYKFMRVLQAQQVCWIV